MRHSSPALAVFLLAALGCGDSGRASVSGSILVDGEPLQSGAISFYPMEGTHGPNAGAVIEDGEYSIPAEKGVAVGKNRVEIRATRATGRRVPSLMAPGTLVDEVVEFVPAEYNTRSTLVHDINRGNNTVNFELSTKRTGR
jgi:hypothetical protein